MYLTVYYVSIVIFEHWGVNSMRIKALSHTGQRRKLNEDCYCISNSDFIYGMVADGMGGHLAGEVASKIACRVIKEYVDSSFYYGMSIEEASIFLKIAFIEANEAIFNYSIENSRAMGMGTTATFALIYKGKLITANVGDSRVYTISENSIEQITKDHSYVQELVDRGDITKEMATSHPKKNYITRAMGTEETVKVDIVINDYNGEYVLICSDGLTNMVSNDDIKNTVISSINLDCAVDKLVADANNAGGIDNITVIALIQGDETI